MVQKGIRLRVVSFRLRPAMAAACLPVILVRQLTSRTLSFVLPVSVKETGLAPQRRAAEDGALMRTSMLLRSFLQNFNQEDLLKFLIVCPARDVQALSTLLKSITSDNRYSVVPELTICSDVAKTMKPHSHEIYGWMAQQLIKLAVCSHFQSEYYVTLDSDILFLKAFSFCSLVREGRALTNVETPKDYERLYVSDFAISEFHIKTSRYKVAADILGYDRPAHFASRFYGETPVIFRTEIVNALTQYLSSRGGQVWSENLATRLGWTEYSLYYQFLEMNGLLEPTCILTSCNGVLDLERSVWQESAKYRSPRLYDSNHFATEGDAKGGYFAAIQSWLPVSSWLPSRCQGLADFYDEVGGWLLRDDQHHA